MEQVSYIHNQNLDDIFSALANGSRRAILRRLAQGQASVNELAEPLEISQPAVSRHLKVLERAGLIERDIDEQRRPAILNAANLAAAEAWLKDFQQFWTGSFDQLEQMLGAPVNNPIKGNNNE
ncbi:MAG: metalloregulator ArsR/SmtB family transcription factor [Pseudomonadota bacterium]